MNERSDTRDLDREEGESEGIIWPARDVTTGIQTTMARDAIPGKTATMMCAVPYQKTRTNVGTIGTDAPNGWLHYLSPL